MENLFDKLKKKKSVKFIDQLLYRFSEDYVVGSGAQLTYFLILSIFPFLIVLLNILSYTSLGREDVIANMIRYLPYDIQLIIEGFVSDVVSSSSQSLLSIAAIGGIWTASSGVKAIIRAINSAYDYTESRSFLKMKAISLVFTIALLILVLVVFITLVLGQIVGHMLFDILGLGDFFSVLWTNLRFVIPLLFMIIFFALLYKYSPNVKKSEKIKFSSTLPGAIFTTLGWVITSLLFSYYVSSFGSYAITYGSLGGVIVLLIWLFISSIIIVLGGEINATLEDLKKHDFNINEEKSVLFAIEKLRNNNKNNA